ncbi:Rid family hydrolase [Achromobacter pestifer]|uniref:RidA family protein n=1 Tax=Achromobacter pestifer TaxID=1353889 RepID=A0A6S7A686_9BURK|nr:Rid family hydrolase [Achromobacter pestifer]CAB3676710.1 hypothetical protein LMG3431_04137 [Achromobacter pestifer]
MTEHAYPEATTIVPTRTGMVAIPGFLAADVQQYHYAPARRAGDFVFVSGVVVANPSPEPMEGEAFKQALRQVFRNIEQLLAACQAELSDVVELQMFHVFGSDHTTLDKAAQLQAIAAVRDEFFAAPYPAAVELAVADLNPPGGLVEIKALAFSPTR